MWKSLTLTMLLKAHAQERGEVVGVDDGVVLGAVAVAVVVVCVVAEVGKLAEQHLVAHSSANGGCCWSPWQARQSSLLIDVRLKEKLQGQPKNEASLKTKETVKLQLSSTFVEIFQGFSDRPLLRESIQKLREAHLRARGGVATRRRERFSRLNKDVLDVSESEDFCLNGDAYRYEEEEDSIEMSSNICHDRSRRACLITLFHLLRQSELFFVSTKMSRDKMAFQE